jgi:hypothetical protein
MVRVIVTTPNSKKAQGDLFAIMPIEEGGTMSSKGVVSQCVICWDALAKVVCIPCGHIIGCMNCLLQIKTKIESTLFKMLLGHMLFNCQPNLLFVVKLTSWASSAKNSNLKKNQISTFNLFIFAL